MSATIHALTSLALVEKLDRAGEVMSFVHADPPWPYGGAAPPGHGRIDAHYGGATLETIAMDIDRSFDVARADCYLAVWVVFPFLLPFAWMLKEIGTRWEPLSGGAWGKTGRRGIGHHLLGDAELLLLLRKGRPQPQVKRSNLWQTVMEGAYWQTPRRGHSEKPFGTLVDLVDVATEPGGTVLDLYAGESASMARACIYRGRGYHGAEVDPKRAAAARRRLAA